MQLQTIRKTGADAAAFLQPEATRTGLQRFFVRGGGWDGYRMAKAQKWEEGRGWNDGKDEAELVGRDREYKVNGS